MKLKLVQSNTKETNPVFPEVKMTSNLKMTVNVSLCGSIPRSQMNFRSKKGSFDLSVDTSKCNNLNSSNLTTAFETCEKLCLPRRVSCEEIHAPSPPPIIEPPS